MAPTREEPLSPLRGWGTWGLSLVPTAHAVGYSLSALRACVPAGRQSRTNRSKSSLI
jgi:hypothetical protein